MAFILVALIYVTNTSQFWNPAVTCCFWRIVFIYLLIKTTNIILYEDVINIM